MKHFVAVLGIIALALFVFAPASEAKQICGDGKCLGTENAETCPEDCRSAPEPPPPEVDFGWQVYIPNADNNPAWNLVGVSPPDTIAEIDGTNYAVYDYIVEVSAVSFRDSSWNDPDLNVLDLTIRNNAMGYGAFTQQRTVPPGVLELGWADPTDHPYWDEDAEICVFPVDESNETDCMQDFMSVMQPVESYQFVLQYRTRGDIFDLGVNSPITDHAELHFAIDYLVRTQKLHSIKCECPASLTRTSPTEWVMSPTANPPEENVECVEYYREKKGKEWTFPVSQRAISVEPFHFKAIWIKDEQN
jgi:hypothetical protein